ncbi:MAG: transporter substrate-binding domain-containing protein [Clostridiales bacterium]|nr:transporter substrate-binding domain-containing protein [Clostridiales bacterium]
MKSTKKILSLFFAVLFIGALFSGCSESENAASEITEDTLIFAYTAENSPFIYTDENGQLAGFDVELVENTFDSFKGDYTDYVFVQVEEGYVLGEDICYTDSAGNEYSAIIYCGGFTKNTGTVNEDYSWSSNIIENNIITAVAESAGESITSYSDVAGCSAAVVSGAAVSALDKNSAVKDSLKAASEYSSAKEAFAALDAGKVDIVIIDEFSYYTYGGGYTVLPGVLDTVEYAFAFDPSEDFSTSFNEAVKELQSADYGDGDELTPIVTEYFASADLCVFQYTTDGDE